MALVGSLRLHAYACEANGIEAALAGEIEAAMRSHVVAHLSGKVDIDWRVLYGCYDFGASLLDTRFDGG